MYPSSYRKRFGPDMEEMFLDALSASRHEGMVSTLALWVRSTWDHARLGILERIEECLAWGRRDWAGMLYEWRSAPRVFRRHPRSALLTVATLSIGIALCAVTLSVVYGTVVRGLPFDAADQLVHFERRSDTHPSLPVTPHDFAYWGERQNSFEGLAAFVEEVVHFSEDGTYPERYTGVRITANALQLLHATPAFGRWFVPSDDEPGAPAVIVLSHGLWRRRFGGDSALVGRRIQLNGQPVAVIGVMPADFGFPIAEQFWQPLQLDVDRYQPGEGRLDVFGRLRAGVSFAEARGEFDQLSRDLERLYPQNDGISADPKTFREEYIGEDFTRRMILLLIGGLVALVVSCLNVTSVLLAWSSQRRREFAVRTALGASGRRIVSQMLGEATLLTAVAALLGLALAGGAVRFLSTIWSRIPVFDLPHGPDALFWWRLELSLPVTACVVVLTLSVSVIAAALPAFHVVRGSRHEGLGIGPRSVGDRSANWLMRVVVVAQVMLTTGLLVPGALMTTSVRRMSTIGSGLESTSIMTGRVGLSVEGSHDYGTVDGQIRFWRMLDERLRGMGRGPAAIASVLPVQSNGRLPVEVGGLGDTLEVAVGVVSRDYFDLFGVTPVTGRTFDTADRVGGTSVVVVNESLANELGGVGAAIGGRLRIGGSAQEPWLSVVGVVPDLWMDGTRNERRAGLYLPLEQAGMGVPEVRFNPWGLRYMTVAMRTDDGGDLDAMRGAVSSLDPTLAVYASSSFADRISGALQRYRVFGAFYAGFSGFAVLLAVLGLYGLMAFSITMRTPEISLRKAVGATTAGVVGGVLREGMVMVAVGAGLGAVIAAWLSLGIQHLLYEITPWSPTVLVAVVGILAATALVACVAPAFRAAGIDPVRTLRAGSE
jgi:putative ABC transport system permease protein